MATGSCARCHRHSARPASAASSGAAAARTALVPRPRVRMTARRARVPPGDLASGPGTPKLDGASWSVVAWPLLLEDGHDVLGAIDRPDREQVMVVVGQGPAPAHGDEPRI